MSERSSTLADYGAGGQTTLDGRDERTLPDREDCERCPDDPDALPCWWHFLAASESDAIDEQHVAERRREVTA